jgi:SAM-dependent methyltransferase
MAVLDCGCGPGSMTLDIAARVGDGPVVGVDMDESQVRLATQSAQARGLKNLTFRQGNAYALPYEADSFDLVFSHALIEHLREPGKALREFLRVLKPGGAVAVCAPDWSGFLYAPATPVLLEAVKAYTDLQNGNGGDASVGHKLHDYAIAAGFEHVRCTARYENFEPLTIITDLVGWQLERNGLLHLAAALREWADQPSGMFAEAWVSCAGRKPAN